MQNTIGAAVLGLGKMGATHVKAALESPYIDKLIGYEPESERAELRGRELKIDTTSDLDSILNDPEIKLIYIASPNGTHSGLAAKSLYAGKSVLCEKPMGETIEEAKQLLQAAEETKGFIQIGFELHYSKMYTTVKNWIDDGLIGTPVKCHCRYYCSEFHLRNSWRSNSPGSLIGEKLSHYLDGQRWFIGAEVEDVYSMHAPNAVTYFNHPDNHHINLRFTNDAIASLDFAMNIAETDPSDPLLDVMEKQADDGHFLQFYIFGTKGAIETDVFKRRIRRWEFTDTPKQLVSKIVETVTFPKEEDNEWFHNVHGQNLRIAELVAKGLPPENPIKNSFESILICFAAELSEQEKRVVKLSEFTNS